MYRNVKRQRHTYICIHAVPLNTDRPSGHTVQKIHRPHWAIFGLPAHSRGRRDTCKNEQKPCILQRSLTPRSITSDTVIRPVKLPKILDLGSLPEIDWRYNVKDQIVLPYVGVSVALLAALVIPVQRAHVHVDSALAHTLDVEAANILGVVENIVRREDLLHTFALADVREHVAEHTRLAASHEVREKVHTSTLTAAVILLVGHIYSVLLVRRREPILGKARGGWGRYYDHQVPRLRAIIFRALTEIRTRVRRVDIPPASAVVEFGRRLARYLHVRYLHRGCAHTVDLPQVRYGIGYITMSLGRMNTAVGEYHRGRYVADDLLNERRGGKYA